VVDLADREALTGLVDGARAVARRQRAILVRVDPECADDDAGARAALVGAGFRHLADKQWSDLNDPRVVMTLALDPPEADLLRALRETHRRHVRGIARRGVTIRPARDEADVARFREIMLEVGERRGFPVRGVDYYVRLWRRFVQRGRGALTLAEKGCELVAGLLTLHVGAKAWLLYTGLTAAGRNLHPNEALWWEGLRTARAAGVTLFNFGGSGTDWPPSEASPGWAVYSFKKGFGAEGLFYTGYYDLVINRPLYRAFRLAEEKLLPRIATSPLLGRIVKR
jgi:lipid II:glycine glycyltransferase (peptidoglycan interpeptide bridge formation enzyme)